MVEDGLMGRSNGSASRLKGRSGNGERDLAGDGEWRKDESISVQRVDMNDADEAADGDDGRMVVDDEADGMDDEADGMDEGMVTVDFILRSVHPLLLSSGSKGMI